MYRRAETELSVSLLPRRYDLAARLLAATVEELGAPASAALPEAAGSRLADESGLPRAGETGPEAAMAALTAALKDHGYEPYDDGEAVRLRNCPFHHLAQRHLSLVCGMNSSLLAAAVVRCPALPLSAVLEPQPGHCCVAFRPRPRDGGRVQGRCRGPPPARVKKMAPTRPHPSAPDEPPGDKLLRPVSGFFYRMRDVVSGPSAAKP
jgi:predicted ArsR family transcriptional regulator